MFGRQQQRHRQQPQRTAEGERAGPVQPAAGVRRVMRHAGAGQQQAQHAERGGGMKNGRPVGDSQHGAGRQRTEGQAHAERRAQQTHYPIARRALEQR